MARSRLGFRLFAAAVVLGAALLVGEGLARGLGLVAPEWQGKDPGDVIMVGHPTRLWGMGEGRRQNAGAVATINTLGLRGELPRVPRPRGRERVLVTGDSSFFGHGVADDDAPAALVGARLRAAGIDADAVNAAIPGYSTEQTLRLLDEVGWALEPTLLVVCNHWSDAHFDHFRDQDLLHTRDAFGGGWLARSALFRLLAVQVDRARGGEGAHLVGWTRHSAWSATGVRRVDPRRYADNLDTIVRAAAARDVGVVLLTPTNRDMARGALDGEEVRRPYVAAQRLVAEAHGVPRVETLPAFIAAATTLGPDALFLDDLHPSAAGNAVVADAIVATLQQAGWPRARLVGRDAAVDTAGIVDPVPAGADPGPMSPQVNLYPGGSEGLAAHGAAPPEAGATHAAAPVPAAAWTLRGTVHAPPGPVEVTVRSLADEKLGAIVLRGETEFAIAVPAGHARVRLEAMGAAGRVEQEVAAGAAPLVVVLGE